MLAALGLVGFLALLAVVLAGFLGYLLHRLTRRVAALERAARSLASENRTLHQKLDSLPVAPVPSKAEAEMALAPLSAAVSLDAGMNLSKRVQILRLSRRGESSAHIASVLNLPTAQVELVLKLQKQVGEAPSPRS